MRGEKERSKTGLGPKRKQEDRTEGGTEMEGKEMNGEGCEKGEKEPGREHPKLSEETAGEKRNREPWGPSLVPTKASKAKYSRSAK